jgi:dTDP-glucose 4,6-dehydratase
MTTLLITGGAGFIGSNFVPYFIKTNPNIKVVNLDKLTYAGALSNVQEI